MKLTKEQKTIIEADDQHIMCIASAGSGKSSTMIEKVVYLLNNNMVKPERLLLTSFSRIANIELIDKLSAKVEKDTLDRVTIKTIHALCFYYIWKYRDELLLKFFQVVSDDYYGQIIRRLYESPPSGFEYPVKKLTKKDGKYLASRFHHQKHLNVQRGLKLNDNKELSYPDNLIYKLVEGNMRQARKITFADIHIYFLYLVDQFKSVAEEIKNRFDYIIIDESQDTAKIQFEIMRKFISDTTKTILISDSRQQIYGFNGSHFSYTDDFKSEFDSKIYTLKETFRFSNKIAKFANLIVKEMEIPDYFKTPTTTNVKVDNDIIIDLDPDRFSRLNKICNDIERKIRSGFKYNDLHVMYRINRDSVIFEKEFRRRKIPFRVLKGSFLEQREIQFVLNALSLFCAFDMTILIDLIKEYGNFIDFKTLWTTFFSCKDTYGGTCFSILTFLSHAFMESIAGVGPKRKKEFQILYNRFSTINTIIKCLNYKDPNSKEGFFKKIAEELCMDETKFMSYDMDNSVGREDAGERWNSIYELDAMFVDYEFESIEEFINLLKTDFSSSDTSEKDDKIDTVTLRTIHKSKGCTLPVVYLIADHIAIFDDNITDEFFVYYVAITRVSHHLYLFHNDFNNFKFNYLLPDKGIKFINEYGSF